MKLCGCGCGQEVTIYKYATRRFIRGHSSKLRVGIKSSRYKPNLHIPHSCECNCGVILTKTKQRFVNGHQSKFNSPYKKGCSSWNYRLTKETDIRVKNYGLKQRGIKRLYISERNLINNPCRYVRNPSKPQLVVFNDCKQEYYPFKTFCNYKVPKLNGGYLYLDVAIPELGLNFEYDDIQFWHSTKNKYYDPVKESKRDDYLRNQGWEVIRISNGN